MHQESEEGCGPDGAAFDACLRLLRVADQVQKRFAQYLEGHDLSVAQFDVLAALDRAEGITQQDLAGRLVVTKSNVVWLIDKLAARGLVERRDDPADRRAHRLHTTAAGRALFRKALPGQRELILELMSGLAADEQRSLAAMLGRVEKAAGG